MHRLIVAVSAIVATFILVPAAMAWNGARITSVSCPEVHVVLPVENGNWSVWAVENGKTVYGPVQVPGFAREQVVGGFYEADNLTHNGVMYAASAADPTDGLVSLPYQVTLCAPPLGARGPAGPTGPAGPVGPAGQNGTNGVTTTVTIVKHEGVVPDTCVSRREFNLTLPKDYRNVTKLTVHVGGKQSEMRVRNGKVHISFKGLKRGVYAVAIRHKGKRTVRRLYTVCNHGNVTAFNVRLPNDPEPTATSRG